jgi:carbon monoxide dehydrogenase subunit G
MDSAMIRLLRNLMLCVMLMLGLALVVLGMARYRPGAGDLAATIAIAASPEAVFATLANMDAAPQWIPGLKPVESLTGAGPMKPGSRYRLTVESGSQTSVMEMHVTVLEAPRRMRFVLTGQGDPAVQFTEVATYDLTPDATGTLVTLSAHTDYHAVITQLFEPLITVAARMQLSDTMANLKRRVEHLHPRK